ncbi:hypothetical protein JHK86_000697 [Glycine max]|nr:hypothetical protein JHK86_000697 [Glycine max]
MSPSSDLFSVTDAEKIVGWALSRHLMQNVETDPNAKLVLSCERKTLNSELWHACAGPLVSLPQVGSLVFYFPQGHSEQAVAGLTQHNNAKPVADSSFSKAKPEHSLDSQFKPP